MLVDNVTNCYQSLIIISTCQGGKSSENLCGTLYISMLKKIKKKKKRSQPESILLAIENNIICHISHGLNETRM